MDSTVPPRDESIVSESEGVKAIIPKTQTSSVEYLTSPACKVSVGD